MNEAPAPQKKRNSTGEKVIIGGLVVVGLWLQFGGGIEKFRTQINRAPAAEVPAGPSLSYTWNWSRERDYIIVNGEATNLTEEPQKYVKAVVSAYQSGGGFVQSDFSYLQYTTLLAGQTSPFKVMMRDNPAISSVSVAFERGGKQIEATNR